MRRRRIIVISAVALLGAALVMFLLMRDTGPPVQVSGNLSTKDVAQIKSAVRRELWKEVFPNCSFNTIHALPRMTKRAFRSHVWMIQGTGNADQMIYSTNTDGKMAMVILTQGDERPPEQGPVDVLFVTNNPGGWNCAKPMSAGWTSYSPLLMTNGR